MADQTAIRCGVLIDGIADEPSEDVTVLVEDGVIVDVGPTDEIDAEAAEHRQPGITVFTAPVTERISTVVRVIDDTYSKFCHRRDSGGSPPTQLAPEIQ